MRAEFLTQFYSCCYRALRNLFKNQVQNQNRRDLGHRMTTRGPKKLERPRLQELTNVLRKLRTLKHYNTAIKAVN